MHGVRQVLRGRRQNRGRGGGRRKKSTGSREKGEKVGVLKSIKSIVSTLNMFESIKAFFDKSPVLIYELIYSCCAY